MQHIGIFTYKILSKPLSGYFPFYVALAAILSQVWWLLGMRRHTRAPGRFGELLHEKKFQRQRAEKWKTLLCKVDITGIFNYLWMKMVRVTHLFSGKKRKTLPSNSKPVVQNNNKKSFRYRSKLLSVYKAFVQLEEDKEAKKKRWNRREGVEMVSTRLQGY